MAKRSFLKGLRLTINSPGTGLAEILLSSTQRPIAIKNIAELACIGKNSKKMWQRENNHLEAKMSGVQICRGGN